MQTRQVITTFQWALPAVMLSAGFLDSFWGLIALTALMGFMIGAYDVTMNAQAILLEKHTKRRYLSSMHAFYSVGGFLGTGFGAACAALSMNVWQTFAAFLITGYALVLWAGKGLLPDEAVQSKSDDVKSQKSSKSVPFFTFVCGFFALCAYIVEGTVGEWGGIYLVTAKGADEATAGLTYGLFSVTVAVFRLYGDKLRQRHSDFTIFGLGSLIAVIGMSTVLLSTHPWVMEILTHYYRASQTFGQHFFEHLSRLSFHEFLNIWTVWKLVFDVRVGLRPPGSPPPVPLPGEASRPLSSGVTAMRSDGAALVVRCPMTKAYVVAR